MKKIYLYASRTPVVKSIRIFGSALNMCCNIDSDPDICIELSNTDIETKNLISEDLQMQCNWRLDILWHDTLDEKDRITEDIRKGVICYGQTVETC